MCPGTVPSEHLPSGYADREGFHIVGFLSGYRIVFKAGEATRITEPGRFLSPTTAKRVVSGPSPLSTASMEA